MDKVGISPKEKTKTKTIFKYQVEIMDQKNIITELKKFIRGVQQKTRSSRRKAQQTQSQIIGNYSVRRAKKKKE